jgi:hypothetical protein
MSRTKTRYVYRHGKRIEVEELVLPNQQRTRAKRKPFKVAWFKFPGWWVKALRGASASAHQLALIVLAEAFKQEHMKGDIVLSAKVTEMAHSTRQRAAKELVELGLITIEQNGRNANTVSAIWYTKRPIPKNG